MLVQTGRASGPAARSTQSVSMARASGMSRHEVRAGPISTATRPSGSSTASSSPASVSSRTRRSPVSSAISRATQRVGVAARLGLAAIGVEDAHEGLRRGLARRLDQDQLIAADPAMAVGQGARRRSIDRHRLAPSVDHDEVVAEPVHLAEGDLTHGAAYMAAAPAVSNPAWRARLGFA